MTGCCLKSGCLVLTRWFGGCCDPFLCLLATVNKTKYTPPPFRCSIFPLIGLTLFHSTPSAGLWCVASVFWGEELYKKNISALRNVHPSLVVLRYVMLKHGTSSRPRILFVTLGSRLTQHVSGYICGSERRKCVESKGFWQTAVSECRTCDSRKHVKELKACIHMLFTWTKSGFKRTRAKPAARRQPSFLTDEKNKKSLTV